MMTRREIQEKSEKSSIESALRILYPLSSLFGNDPEIIDKPNPPDAIVQQGNKIFWVEHTNAYRSKDEARELWTHVVPGEKPYTRKEGIIIEPDKQMSLAIRNAVVKKMTSDSYAGYFEKHGQGILIISERDPLFSSSSLDRLQNDIAGLYQSVCWKKFDNKGFFHSVYLLCRIWRRGNVLVKIYPEYDPTLMTDWFNPPIK